MHVLVTGGAGFIGSHSVEALLEAGAEVTVLDNFSAGKRSNLPADAKLRVVEGDIRDTTSVERAMMGVDRILHLAAQVSVRASVDEPVLSASHNVTGFLNVANAARRSGALRFVYASSAAVYGAPHALPLDEESVCEPLSPYGLEKLVNDQYAALFGQLYGTSTLGLRYFNVYGPRQDPASPYAGVISRFASRLAGDEPLKVFGDGQQTRDFIFVKDVARANVAALRSTFNGVLNVGTGSSVSLLELIETLGACAGRTPVVHFDPPAPGDIRHSAMRPNRIREALGFVAKTKLRDGLRTLV
ncbi:MAG: NAD-dependent epimerase/dehydratase family protein [Betaproteobacteria bacterium]|nr:MAG: NAD-dependent epimerase/dehydratase family protein [Betaproteobacteria bacterium]